MKLGLREQHVSSCLCVCVCMCGAMCTAKWGVRTCGVCVSLQVTKNVVVVIITRDIEANKKNKTKREKKNKPVGLNETSATWIHLWGLQVDLKLKMIDLNK